jgi:hypothetical protein
VAGAKVVLTRTRQNGFAAMTDQILAKVRKLLAKAEDPAATAEEAEIYTAKAAELVAEYGIDRALLAQADPSSDVVGDRVVLLDAPYALDKANLLSGVAIRMRCRCVQRVRYVDRTKQISIHLFGYESDLFRAEVLYTSLLLQATSTLARTPVPGYESAAAFRRSWLAGFTAAVTGRLAASERAAEQRAEERAETTSTAGRSVSLVLADRSVAVDSAVHAEYPSLGKARSRQLSGSGGLDGWAAGQRADLGGGPPVSARSRGQLTG